MPRDGGGNSWSGGNTVVARGKGHFRAPYQNVCKGAGELVLYGARRVTERPLLAFKNRLKELAEDWSTNGAGQGALGRCACEAGPAQQDRQRPEECRIPP